MFINLKENAIYDKASLYRLIRYSNWKLKDEEIDELLSKVRTHDNYYILGYYENEILIGLLIYRIEGYSANIIVLSVEKDKRGKGIGTRLLKEVHEKYKNIKIETRCELNAVDFYKRLGFTVKSIGQNFYKDEEFHCWIEY